MDVYLMLVSVDNTTVMENISGALGIDGNKKMLPLIYSVNVDLSSYTFGGHDNKNVIINTILDYLVANCTDIHSISIVAQRGPTSDDNGVPIETLYTIKSSLYDSISKERYIIDPKRFEGLLALSSSSLERLTHSTFQINNLSQQIPDTMTSSLWSLQALDIKYSFLRLARNQDISRVIQLDLPKFCHLKSVKLDLTVLDWGDDRHKFFCIKLSNDDKKKKNPAYYEFEEDSLAITARKFMNGYKRFEPERIICIVIKLSSNAEEFIIYNLATRISRHQDMYINVPLWKGDKENVMDKTSDLAYLFALNAANL